MIPLFPELLRIATIFEQHHVTYAVVGGIAVRALGVPRPTYDLDLTIIHLEDNQQLLRELEKAEYEVPEIYRNGWLGNIAGLPLLKVKVWKNLEAVDIDIFVAETDFQKSLLKRKQLVDVEGNKFWCATAEDVIVLKILADRLRDRVDVQDILFMQPLLDVTYLRHWSEVLGVENRLLDALRQNDEYLPHLNN